jgi:GAF domain-containing protein
VFLVEAGQLRLAAVRGVDTAGITALHQAYPRPIARDTTSGRAILDRRMVHLEDSWLDPEYTHPLRDTIALRSILTVPIFREGIPLGAISVWRGEPRPFSDKQVALLQTFTEQAVIAIENVRLFKELEARNSELRVSLEQQTATSELLKVIGRSTFDLQPVFETLAENAVRLCEAERAIVWRFEDRLLRVAATHNASPELQAFLQANPIVPGHGSATARAAVERRTKHVHDAQADPEYTYGSRQVDPIRTLLAIPMLRADELLGVITIYRHEVRPAPHRAPDQERRSHRGPGAADSHQRHPAGDQQLPHGCPARLRRDRGQRRAVVRRSVRNTLSAIRRHGGLRRVLQRAARGS